MAADDIAWDDQPDIQWDDRPGRPSVSERVPGVRDLSEAGPILAKTLWSMVRPGQYPNSPPALSRGAGESDRDYAARQAHADFAHMSSPDGISDSATLAAYGMPGAGARPPPLPGKSSLLGRWAEAAALRSTNADRNAYKNSFGRGPEAAKKAHEVGRFLLDEGVPLRTPQAMRNGLADVIADRGVEIKNLVNDAKNAGGTFNLWDAASDAMQKRDVAKLAGNTEEFQFYDRVLRFFADQLSQHGPVTAPDLARADVRQPLGRFARFNKYEPKPEELRNAWRASYGAVNDELRKTMKGVGLERPWNEANRAEHLALQADDLAAIGAERRAANKWVSPGEKAAGFAGLVSGAASHNPTPAVALPLTYWVLNRYGMPTAAHAFNATDKLLQTVLRKSQNPGIGAKAAAGGLAVSRTDEENQ